MTSTQIRAFFDRIAPYDQLNDWLSGAAQDLEANGGEVE